MQKGWCKKGGAFLLMMEENFKLGRLKMTGQKPLKSSVVRYILFYDFLGKRENVTVERH